MNSNSSSWWIRIGILAILFVGGLVLHDHDEDVRSEAYSEGYEAGYYDGNSEHDDAISNSYEDGYSDGYVVGYTDALADSIPMPDPSQPDLGYDISWTDVDSTMFQAVGYDRARSVLGVLFQDSGNRYYYLGFPESEYTAFLASDSLGGYYNDHIKGSYYSFRQDGSSTGANPYD